VSDPAIGVDISAGERQQRRDGEGFLAVEIQVSCAISRYVLIHSQPTLKPALAVTRVGICLPKRLDLNQEFLETRSDLGTDLLGGSLQWTPSNGSFRPRRKFFCCWQ
jgi:hypothetical protein